MKAQNTRKTRRRSIHPLAKLDVRVQLTNEEILADLQYPAPNRGSRPRG
jgi:hypothetical protein